MQVCTTNLSTILERTGTKDIGLWSEVGLSCMGYLGHWPDDGRFPLLQNYSRVDREVGQVRQWIDRSREAQNHAGRLSRPSAVWWRRSKSPNIRYSDTSAWCFSTVCFFRGSEYAMSYEVLA